MKFVSQRIDSNNGVDYCSKNEVVAALDQQKTEITSLKQLAADSIAASQQAPILNMASDRKRSIINNTPAVFEIADNPTADGSKPAHEIDFFSEVPENEGIIMQEAKAQGVDPNIVKAIMYMETTHGRYDALDPTNVSERPMNINKDYWSELGYSAEQLEDPAINIKAGVTIIQRITTRINNPTVAKIATVYNVLGKESVSDYGARVQQIYDKKLWEEK